MKSGGSTTLSVTDNCHGWGAVMRNFYPVDQPLVRTKVIIESKGPLINSKCVSKETAPDVLIPGPRTPTCGFTSRRRGHLEPEAEGTTQGSNFLLGTSGNDGRYLIRSPEFPIAPGGTNGPSVLTPGLGPFLIAAGPPVHAGGLLPFQPLRVLRRGANLARERPAA